MTTLLIKTPIGDMRLVENEGRLVRVDLPGTWSEPKEKLTGDAAGQESESPLLAQARKQLEEYFRGERQVFDLPLNPQGTAFQHAVWQALGDIPYGETRSYRDIAIAVGRAKAMRAVGGANHANPIAIIIPCHRVIGADGSLTGYGGGLKVKGHLLQLERAYTSFAQEVL